MSKNKKVNYLILCAYLLLIGLLVYFVLEFKDAYTWADERNAQKVETKLFEAVEEEQEDIMIQKVDKAVIKYDFDVVMMLDDELIYSTIPYYEGDTLEPRVNHMQISISSFEEYDYHYQTLGVWYTIYKINDSSLVSEFLKFLIIISSIIVILLCLSFYLLSTRLFIPMKNIRKSIELANHYDFNKIEDKEDALNKSFKNFVSDLQSNLSTVSRQHTELEKRLQAKREHLNNVLIVSRSMVHDLKTPIHRNILENEAYAKEYADNRDLVELAQLNQNLNHVIMKDVNRILGMLKNDGFKMKVEIKEVDVIETLQRSLTSLHRNMLKKELTLDLDVPEDLTLTAEETTFILLINNLLSNMILYAEDNSEVKVYADKTDSTVTLSFYNKASLHNINAMLNTETMFNEVKHPESGDYIYHSGNGLFLIKELTTMLDAEYLLETTEESVYIKVVFHY